MTNAEVMAAALLEQYGPLPFEFPALQVIVESVAAADDLLKVVLTDTLTGMRYAWDYVSPDTWFADPEGPLERVATEMAADRTEVPVVQRFRLDPAANAAPELARFLADRRR